MEGEPGRDAKAEQVQKTQCKDTTSHCFMRALIENNADDPVFRPLHTRCNGCTLTNVFGMLLKYQSRVNFGTPGNSWAPGNQSRTGRMGLKDRCEGKLFGRSETTSSLARAYGINTHLFFLQKLQKVRHARSCKT